MPSPAAAATWKQRSLQIKLASLPRLSRRPRAGRLRDEGGFSMIELLVVIGLLVVVAAGAMTALQTVTTNQARDEAYSEEITATQSELARLTHDLRQATTILDAQPYAVQFLMPSTQTVNGQTQQITLDIRYDCTQSDSLGSPYTRCARLQSVYPNPLPTPPSAAGNLDIQHVENGSIDTYCNGTGSAPSGSVFFYSNSNTANPDSSPPACDQNYQLLVAERPDYVQVLIQVPASGDLHKGGMTHTSTFSSGVYLRNWNLGA